MERDDEDWVEVTDTEPEPEAPKAQPSRAPQKKHRPFDCTGYTALAVSTPSTWPDLNRRIEFETLPGGLVECPSYVHAFGFRTSIDRVFVPILKKLIPLRNILKWRYVS